MARKLVAFLRAAALLRLHGVSYRGTPMIYGPRPIIRRRGVLAVGEAFRVQGGQFPALLSAASGATLRIGSGVYVNQGANVHAAASVTIGDHVYLADLATIYDTNFHEVEPGEGVVVRPVVVEDNVWLGRGALVLPGVRIGRNSVVAAGAVVTESIPPDSVAAGNPARVVRELRRVEGWVRV